MPRKSMRTDLTAHSRNEDQPWQECRLECNRINKIRILEKILRGVSRCLSGGIVLAAKSTKVIRLSNRNKKKRCYLVIFSNIQWRFEVFWPLRKVLVQMRSYLQNHDKKKWRKFHLVQVFSLPDFLVCPKAVLFAVIHFLFPNVLARCRYKVSIHYFHNRSPLHNVDLDLHCRFSSEHIHHLHLHVGTSLDLGRELLDRLFRPWRD